MSTNQITLTEFPNITLFIKREDLLHPFVSGNKFRKLKYNLQEAQQQKQTTLLTFGGAFSNHIAAVAAAGKGQYFKTIGIIRGDEIETKIQNNPTLRFAQECGMLFEFLSREDYRKKSEPNFLLNLKKKWGAFYLIPEGGTNALAVKGCEEILDPDDATFDFICCSVGTGGTISGLINSAQPHQKILGFPALKGNFLNQEIRKFATKDNWKLITDYHFGGYAKVTTELIDFINLFLKDTGIPLDPIYTGKMVFGVIDLMRLKYFPPGSKILLIHTGGIQGIEGMNIRLKNKKSTLLITHD